MENIYYDIIDGRLIIFHEKNNKQKKIAIAVFNSCYDLRKSVIGIKLTKYCLSGDFQFLLIEKNGYNYYRPPTNFYPYDFGNCLIQHYYDDQTISGDTLQCCVNLGNNYRINIFSNSKNSFKNLNINIDNGRCNLNECKNKPYGKMDDELQRKVEDLYEMFLAKKHFESLSK